MAYAISDDCIACGACQAECPVEAISEGDGKYVIDAEKCIDCGSCAATCPDVYKRQILYGSLSLPCWFWLW